MWPAFAAQAASSLLGGFFGNRSADDAEDEYRAASASARKSAAKAEKRAVKRLNKATDRLADRAENRARTQAQTFARQSESNAAQTLSVSRAAASAERQQVMADEATRFTRLREAAEAGGFNPLTVLASGFTGASLPTGLLSADWHLAHGGMKADAISTRYAARTALDGAIQGQRMDGQLQAVAMGQNASQVTYDQIMRGHEGAVQSGQAAHDATANVWRDMGNVAVSAWDARQGMLRDQRADAFERERLDLEHDRFASDQEQFAYERDYNARVLASAGGRLPGYGGARIATAGGVTLSPDGVEMPNISINGHTFSPNPNVSDPETVQTGMGGFWGEVVTGVANAPSGIAQLDELIFYGPARDYAEATRNGWNNFGRWWNNQAGGLRSQPASGPSSGPYQSWGGL